MECFRIPTTAPHIGTTEQACGTTEKGNVLYTFWFLTKQKVETQTHCLKSIRIGLELHGELNHIDKLLQLEIQTLDTSLAP